MNDLLPLLKTLRAYGLALDALDDWPVPPVVDASEQTHWHQEALQVLLQRDAMQQHLETGIWIPAERLITLQQLDQRLRAHRLSLVRVLDLEQWRSLRNPPEQYWWWYLEPPALFPWLETRHPWLERLDWLWTFLSLFALTFAITIVLDTLNRVVGEGLNTAGMLPVVIQILLTLAGGAAALTAQGRTFIKTMMGHLRIPKPYWAEMSALVSGLVLILVASIFQFYIPYLANQRHDAGQMFFEAGQFDSALQAYQQAIALQPDFVEAHYSLGVLQEDLQRPEAAIAEYQIVTRSDPGPVNKLIWLRAHNNLGRLYLLQGDYRLAWVPLERAYSALQERDRQSPEMQVEEYNLLKNLGWTWLGQGRWIEADEYLQQAIALNPQRSVAYCLQAQALEGLEQSPAEVTPVWEHCLSGDHRQIQPEEAEWAALARERLTQE